MAEITLFRWRVQWLGKWVTTRYDATEDDIRKQHPEAVRIDSTRVVRQVPTNGPEWTSGFFPK
jgi:hypothetical protein